MYKIKIILILSFLAKSSVVMAAGLPVHFEAFTLIYSISGGKDANDSATLTWDIQSKSCRFTPPGAHELKLISFEECKSIYSFLSKNQKAFDAQLKTHKSVESTHLLTGPHRPLAELQFGTTKVAVQKDQATWCDENHQNCTKENFDLVDQAGELVRKLVAKHL